MDPKIAQYLEQYRIQDLWDEFLVDYIESKIGGDGKVTKSDSTETNSVASDLHKFLCARLEKEKKLLSEVNYIVLLAANQEEASKVVQPLCEQGVAHLSFSPSVPNSQGDEGIDLSNISTLEADIIERGIQRKREFCTKQFRNFVEKCHAPGEKKVIILTSVSWPSSIGDVLSLEREVGEPAAVIDLGFKETKEDSSVTSNIVLAGREAGLWDKAKERECLLEYCKCKNYLIDSIEGDSDKSRLFELLRERLSE